ncbi:hypothetical protein [Agaribacterium haliotis]|uniref:hypothetical protein n=1 Tax=Agaribacterium haliotis TaxID=2013869 RepID=UPI000BB52D79|nr:hypothetical protein [Agaribacterium haliotis]
MNRAFMQFTVEVMLVLLGLAIASQVIASDNSDSGATSAQSDSQLVQRDDAALQQHTELRVSRFALASDKNLNAEFRAENQLEKVSGLGSEELATRRTYAAAFNGSGSFSKLSYQTRIAYAANEEQQVQNSNETKLSYNEKLGAFALTVYALNRQSQAPGSLAWGAPLQGMEEDEELEQIRNRSKHYGVQVQYHAFSASLKQLSENYDSNSEGEREFSALELSARYELLKELAFVSSMAPVSQKHIDDGHSNDYIAYRAGFSVKPSKGVQSEWLFERGAHYAAFDWADAPKAQLASRTSISLNEFTQLNVQITQPLELAYSDTNAIVQLQADF